MTPTTLIPIILIMASVHYCTILSCLAGTFAVISLMIGGVAVRIAPDEMFHIVETNVTNSTEYLEKIEARDAMRVKVAVAITLLCGLIQVPVCFTVCRHYAALNVENVTHCIRCMPV